MALFQEIINEIKPVIIAAVGLPAAPTGSKNWFTAIGGLSQNFVAAINGQKVTLPCIVVSTGDWIPDTEYGVGDVLCKRMPVSIFYITQVAGTDGTQDSCSNQAINVAVAFDGTPEFNTFQIIEPGTILSNIDGEINSPLHGISKVSVIAASVSWSPGFQVQFVTPTEE